MLPMPSRGIAVTYPFEAAYAAVYDLIYEDKDYVSECDLIERVVPRIPSAGAAKVLDLGCGTGRHAACLAARGYSVTGVDRSADMLRIAQARVRERQHEVSFHLADIRSLRLKQQFDLVIMTFNVLGYQPTCRNAVRALSTARHHLRAGGRVIFDVWYGPAVLAQLPQPVTKTVANCQTVINRTATPALNVKCRLCEVWYHLEESGPRGVIAETHELHVIRYFFPEEIERALNDADLRLVDLSAFPDAQRRADTSTWSVMVIARAPARALSNQVK